MKGDDLSVACTPFVLPSKYAKMDEQNNLAYLLHKELLKTAEKFMKKCPNADHNVILGAGNLYIAGFLINAPSKEKAKESLDSCVEVMRQLIESTPDNFFGGGIRKHFNPHLN